MNCQIDSRLLRSLKQKKLCDSPLILCSRIFSVRRFFKYILFFAILLAVPYLHAQNKETFFWDSVESLSGRNYNNSRNSYFPVALYDAHNAYIFYESVDKARQEIKISWRQKKDNLLWSDTFSLKDSFKYYGDSVPDMYSAALSPLGTIAVSVIDSSSANGVIKVYSSSDSAASFSEFTFPPQKKQITSSRIFSSGDGSFILFISLGEGKQSPTESSFSILYSESADGKKWSDLKFFNPASAISNAFSPFFTKINGNDFVFFEGWNAKDSTTSLIYASTRAPGGIWSEPFIVTDSSSMPDSSYYLDFKNFRPFVLSDGQNTKIIWERTSKTGSTATVMVAPLSSEGKIIDRADVESLNAFGNGRRPSLFLFHDKFFALWFDDRNGVNNVHLAENLGVQWIEVDSIQLRQDKKISSSFPCAFILAENSSLCLAWQEDASSTSISMLCEDYRASKPEISARNFKIGKRGGEKNPSVRVVMPKDISGVEGWSGIWTTDKNALPEKNVFSSQYRKTSDNVISAKIPDDLKTDEIVYFKACVLDKAGNWSETASLEYYYDCTPPKKVTEISFDKDEWGFASSNDVAFSWQNDLSDTDEVAGYSWTLTRIAPIDKNLAVTKSKKLEISPEESSEILSALVEQNEENFSRAKIPASKIASSKSAVSFKNRDNGLYVFSVRAIDSVGNAGEPENCIVFLNKYKAATLIRNVEAVPDDFGNVAISVSGEEFSYDGEISEVILTQKESGKKFIFKKDEGDYSIKKGSGSLEKISGIKIDGMKSGNYSVQIRHSERGLSTWRRNLVIGENGTVKYEKQYNFEPIWKIIPKIESEYSVNTDSLLFWSLIVLIMLGIFVCFRGIIISAGDMVKIRKEVALILTGEYMEQEKIEKIHSALRNRYSLKVKFGFLITGLLLFIVAGISFAIGSRMMLVQERILISGLKDRVKVVMGNMASGLETYLDDGREKIVEIGAIVNQTDNFPESEFATIISHHIDGYEVDDESSIDYKKKPLNYVWATNDADILEKITSPVFDAGTVQVKASLNSSFRALSIDLNNEAKKIVDDLSRTTADNSNLIFRKLNEFSAQSFTSYPYMDDNKLDHDTTEYDFYWPVIYQKANNNVDFLQAIIILRVSTSTLLKQIEDSRNLVMYISFASALIAALIALVSSFTLSSIITNPIMKIVSHVKKITETENKLLLEGVEIKITSRDELRTLGDSVNEMTKGLVKGAKDEERAKIAYQRAAKEREKAARAQAEEAKARAEAAEMSIMNLDGQAVQKAFIPLVSEGAEKETVAELKEKEIQLYGYYEGTDAVSGDYFDYKKLDERWYAFIKCDASGHGVPAALIMTIVATIFRRYFATWKFEKNGVKLNLLASDINDFIESLGLRGKFAAMMICLFDTKTGDVYTCNAGDNILRVFDSDERKIKVITLHEAPAAGPLPSFMVEMKGGYKVEKIHLKSNDVLFLYTDGIEESTRFFRNADFEVIACNEPNLKEGEIHATHKKGEQSEQMEPSRVQDIIESVLNKRKYVLTRYHSPVAGEKLEFDFTKCEGTIENAIIALTAVEKVFRMYKKPDSTGRVEKTEMDLEGKKKTVIQIFGDGIKIDRKIDAFLSKYFNLYDYYCVNKVDEGETNYVYYTGVSEDVQADDLTLLAIKRM